MRTVSSIIAACFALSLGVACDAVEPADAGPLYDAGPRPDAGPPRIERNFVVGESVRGTIFPPDGWVHDEDRFAAALSVGTVFEMELGYADPLLELEVTLESAWEPTEHMPAVYAVLDGDASRQVFIPRDGVYVVTIRDIRPPDMAFASWGEYRVDTRLVRPLPIRRELTSNGLRGDLAGGDVAIHPIWYHEPSDVTVPLDGECTGPALRVHADGPGLSLWAFDPSFARTEGRSGTCTSDAPDGPGADMCTFICADREWWVVVQASHTLADGRYSLTARIDATTD